jgi:GAF domain-containing protein
MKQTIIGAAETSVTLVDGKPKTVAFSGELALDLDERQYATGYGPCLDAARLGEVVLMTDAATETRWPAYTPKMIEAELVGSISIPLEVDGSVIGALNTYFTSPDGLDATGVAVAESLGHYASIVLSNADLYFTAESRAEQMHQAMQSRATIEQAKGILMGQRRCSSDEAFDILVRLSQQSGRKLRDVAQALVDTATQT